MKLNKMIPLFLAVMMIFSAVPIGVSAEGGAQTTPSYLHVVGTEISATSNAVQIKLESSTDVCGGSFTVSYDSAVLEAYGVDVPSNAPYMVQTNHSVGKVKISFASAEAIADGLLVSVCFRIKVDSSTTTQIMLEGMKLSNANGEEVDTEAKNAVCSVKKIVGPQNVTLSKTKLILGSGDSYELKALFDPTDAVVDTFSWSSYDESIVKVDQNGVLTAYGTGTTTIEYYAYSELTWSHWTTCEVTVYSKPSIAVSGAEASVGALVTLPVRMEASGNSFTAGSMNFEYDPEYLRLVSCTAGELLTATMVTVNQNYREDAMRMNFAGQLPLAGAGTLCTLTFEVLKEGSTTVRAADVLLYGEEADSYHSELKSGTVNVSTGTLSVSDYSGNLGLGFIVKLGYNGKMPIAGGSVTLQYDPTKLMLGSVEVLDPSVVVFTNEDQEAGSIKISFAGTANQTEMDIIKLSFVSVGSESTLTSVEISTADLYNADAGKIAPACKNGRVMLTVPTDEPVTEGDLNNDGGSTTVDAILLANILAGNSVSAVLFEAGDLNGDGWLDDADMLMLMKQLIA